IGSDLVKAPGGKGANQAVAAARAGAAVEMLGAVGDDAMGRELVEVLEGERIGTGRIAFEPRAATGAASITVDRRGENTIVVSPGANACVTPRRARAARAAIERAA